MNIPSVITVDMEQFAIKMIRHAKRGVFDGQTWSPYFLKANRTHVATGTRALLTRETGYHASGWFKNPDYERCWHLSLSFWDTSDLEHLKPRPFDEALSDLWVQVFFRDKARYLWIETDDGRGKSIQSVEVRHYRVFCDPAWQAILPRGEVYTRDFTEKGWLSFSDKIYADRQRESK